MLDTVFTHDYWMKQALKEAQKAFDQDEVPVGAIVVMQQKIIARGHNMIEQLNDPTAHAEMIALTSAFSYLGAKYLPEATLYVTLEPCLMCAGALYWSKIAHVVYGATDEKNGCQGHAATAKHLYHPKTQVVKNVMANECSQLMKDFFGMKRNM
jgi:tRNA(adenine34) deaminase